MGAGDSFGVEPPVAAGGEFEGELVVLEIIFSHIDMEAVAAYIVERLASDFNFFTAASSADIAAFHQLFTDLYEILLLHGDIQCGKDGFQMGDFFFYLHGQLRERFVGPLHLSVFIKVFFSILLRRERGVKRYDNRLPVIVVYGFQRLCAGSHVIAVSVQKLAVDLIGIPFLGIFHLAQL